MVFEKLTMDGKYIYEKVSRACQIIIKIIDSIRNINHPAPVLLTIMPKSLTQSGIENSIKNRELNPESLT